MSAPSPGGLAAETGGRPLARLIVLMAAMFVDMMGMLMVLPLVPFYAEKLGGTPTVVGILVASHAFAALVTAPYWGRVSDRWGRRPVILLGLTASGLAYLAFGLADTIWLLLLSRLVQGAGAGTVGVVQAYVTDTVGPGQRAKALGWISAATSAGVTLGPVIGSLATRLGHQAPGYIAAAMALVNVLVAARLLPEPAVSRERRVPRPLRHAVGDVFRHPLQPAHRMIWIYAAGMMAFMAMNAVLALFLERRLGVGTGNIGYFYTYVGAIGVVMRAGILGRLVDRLGDVRVLRLGAVLLTLGQALLPFVGNLAQLALVIALVPIGTALLFPATSSQVSLYAPAGQVGEFMGLQQAMGGVSRMVGPLWAGVVFQHLGVPWPFWLAAILMATVGVLAFGATPRAAQPAEGNDGASAPVVEPVATAVPPGRRSA